MRSMKNSIRTTALVLGLLAGSLGLAVPDAAAQNRVLWNARDGVAIGGYDPVAYFETGEPTPGDAALAYSWGDVAWHFATAEHEAAFRENPEAYAPQYGGFGAFAMTLGGGEGIDPAAF